MKKLAWILIIMGISLTIIGGFNSGGGTETASLPCINNRYKEFYYVAKNTEGLDITIDGNLICAKNTGDYKFTSIPLSVNGISKGTISKSAESFCYVANPKTDYTIKLGPASIDLILLIDAQLLDNKKKVVENITYEMKYPDNITKVIPNNYYVRILFEINLTEGRVINIYLKNETNGTVEMYAKDSDRLIDTANVTKGYHYANLHTDSLTNSAELDFKFIGAQVVDYIVDPQCTGEVIPTDCTQSMDSEECPQFYESSGGTYYQCVWTTSCVKGTECTLTSPPAYPENLPPYFYNVTTNGSNGYVIAGNSINFSSIVTDRETFVNIAQFWDTWHYTLPSYKTSKYISGGTYLTIGNMATYAVTFKMPANGEISSVCAYGTYSSSSNNYTGNRFLIYDSIELDVFPVAYSNAFTTSATQKFNCANITSSVEFLEGQNIFIVWQPAYPSGSERWYYLSDSNSSTGAWDVDINPTDQSLVPGRFWGTRDLFYNVSYRQATLSLSQNYTVNGNNAPLSRADSIPAAKSTPYTYRWCANDSQSAYDCSQYYISAKGKAVVEGNQFLNGGFEMGNLSYWTTTGGGVVTSPVYEGNYAYRIKTGGSFTINNSFSPTYAEKLCYAWMVFRTGYQYVDAFVYNTTAWIQVNPTYYLGSTSYKRDCFKVNRTISSVKFVNNPTSSSSYNYDIDSVCLADANGDCYVGYDIPSGSIRSPTNNSNLSGITILDGVASDQVSGIGTVSMNYRQNSTIAWANLTGCDKMDVSYDCLWDTRNLTIWDKPQYEFRIVPCDLAGNCNYTIELKTYNIVPQLPYLKTKNVVYPSGQSSVRNTQTLAIKLNMTSNSSAVEDAFIDLTFVNGTTILINMTLESGNITARQYSYWNISSIVNAATQNPAIVNVYINDSANNQRKEYVNVIIDNDAPSWANLSNDYEPVYNNSLVTFSADAMDNYNLSDYIFSINSTGTWWNATSKPFITLAELVTKQKMIYELTLFKGSYQYLFYIFDDAGNVVNTSRNDIIVLGELSSINLSLIAPANNSLIGLPYNFSFNFTTVQADTCFLVVDGNKKGNITSPTINVPNNITLQPILGGEHEWFITCNGSDGNNYPSESWNFSNTDQYPYYTDFKNNASTVTVGNATVNWSINLNDLVGLSSYKFAFNGSGIMENVSSSLLSGATLEYIEELWLANRSAGNYLCGQFWFNDTYGNVNQTSLADSGACFTVASQSDTTPPGFSNNRTTANLTTPKINDVIQINLTVSDNIAVSAIKLTTNNSGTMQNESGQLITASSSPITAIFNFTITSKHSLIQWQVWANDTSGNTNTSEIRYFTIANTLPAQPTIIYPIDGKNYSDIPYINYSSSDADSDTITYQIYINGTLNTTLNTNLTDWNATDGFYNLTVTANDGIDSSANSSEVHFRLDSTKPSFLSFQNNATSTTYNGTDVQFNITYYDLNGVDYYKWAHNDSIGGTWTNSSAFYAGSTSFKAIINESIENFPKTGGTYGVIFWANDTSGNTNTSQAFTFTVASSTTPPTCVLISRTPADINDTSTGQFQVVLNCTDADGINVTKTGDHYWAFVTRTLEGLVTPGLPNRWSIRPPDNDIAQVDALLSSYGKIMRAQGRGEGYWYDSLNTASNAGDNNLSSWLQYDNYSYAVNDGEYHNFTIVNTSATSVTITDTVPSVRFSAFRQNIPLSYESLVKENKKNISINKLLQVLVYRNDLEAMKGSQNYTVTVFRNIGTTTTKPAAVLRAFYCNSSYSPTGGVTVLTSPNCALINSMTPSDLNATVLADRNSSYSSGFYSVTNGKIGGIGATPYHYYYYDTLESNPTRAYHYAYANGTTNTNMSFAQTKRTWTSANSGASWTQFNGTLDLIEFSTKANNDELQFGYCVYDLAGNLGCNKTVFTDTITQTNHPITSPAIIEYNSTAYLADFDLNQTHKGIMNIRVGIAKDPDSVGNVTHNLTLRNTDGSWNYTINSSFLSPLDAPLWINLNTSKATDGKYRMNVTATSGDNPLDIKTFLTANNFTIDNTPPSYSNFTNNATGNSVYGGDVTWNITLTDMTGISEVIFADNATGTWSNWSFYFPAAGTTSIIAWHPLSPTTFYKTRGNIICGQYWFNDSVGNFNQTNLSCFTVANTIPTTPLISYPVDGKNYSDIPYINYSSSDADSDTITYQIYINGTLNTTLNTNLTDWNATDGFYNLTVTANDGYGSSSNSSEIHFRLDSTTISFTNMINRTLDDGTDIFYTDDSIFLNATIIGDITPGTAIVSWNSSDGVWHNNTPTNTSNAYSWVLNATNISNADDIWLGWKYYVNNSAGQSIGSDTNMFFVNKIPVVVTVTSSASVDTGSSGGCNYYAGLYKQCYYTNMSDNTCRAGCLPGYLCGTNYSCILNEITPTKFAAKTNLNRALSAFYLIGLTPFVKNYLNGSWLALYVILLLIPLLSYLAYKWYKKRRKKPNAASFF